MYAGHAAIALAIKSRRPDVPIIPLLLAAYGPDWVDVALMIPKPREGMAPWSHSIPAVLVGAACVTLLYRVIARRPGGLVLGAAWISHWIADLVTGLKPLVGLDPLIGLDVYHLPPVDFVIEMLLVSLACLEYGGAFAPRRAQRRIVVALWAALVASQACLDYAVSKLDPNTWRPSLAQVRWRPHVSSITLVTASPVTPHASCTVPGHSFGSETCRQRGRRES